MDLGYVIVGLGASLLTAVGGLFAIPRTLAKMKAETKKINADGDSGAMTARAALMDVDNDRFGILWDRLDAVERRYSALLGHVSDLEEAMRTGGLPVPPRPKDATA